MKMWFHGVATIFVVVLPAAAQVAAEDDIRGPKPLIEIPAPGPATPWLTYAVWGLVLVVVIGVFVWWFMRRRAPGVTAADRARRELDQLGRDSGSMSAGDFAAAASQVVRVFIEKRFGLAAPKRTTEEFLMECSKGGEDRLRSSGDQLREFLRSCDKAKFAAAELDAGTRGELMANARSFVDVSVEMEGAK